MSSIYNVSAWVNPQGTGGAAYKKNAIVKHNDKFWYALKDTDDATAPAAGSAHWGGNMSITIGGTSAEVPYFVWKSSYNVQVSHQPRIQTIQFGDGYEQRLKDGINNNKLSFNLSFEGRTQNEATAILHFLNDKEGYASFYFKTPPPYSLIKKFVCKQFNSSFIYEDNYNVQCTLEEVS